MRLPFGLAIAAAVVVGGSAAVAETGVMPPGRAAAELNTVELGDVDPGDVRTRLAAAGWEIVTHLSADRWLVAGAGFDPFGGENEVRLAGWESAEAISDGLLDAAAAAKAADAGDRFLVVRVLGDRVDAAASRLAAAGAELVWRAPAGPELAELGVRVPATRLAGLVEVMHRLPGLVVADLQPPVRLRNAGSVWRCQSGEPGSTPVFSAGLYGEGQVIGIMDTGIDADECRFDDPAVGLPAVNDAAGTDIDHEHRKILAVDFHWQNDWPPDAAAWDDHGHGTHVAGSAAGDVGGNGLFDGVDGMAPAAKLVIQDGGAAIDDCADLPGLGCPVKPLGPVLEQAWMQGARLHTNSWGDEENIPPFGRYTERTADVDRFSWEHKSFLVFFAAGNAGPLHGTVGSPATGKNVVSVGAAEHGSFEPICVAPFSSRGPTRDGRIKPDVLAPGLFILSAASNRVVPDPSCGNAQSSGTSMASPTVAGLAALVRQYFTDGFSPSGRPRPEDAFEPSAALVKAVLIASAVDLSTTGCAVEPIPSRDQGWGLIELDTALFFAGDRRRMLVDDHRVGFAAASDDPVRLAVAVTEPGRLKVVLVWTDAPSTSLADVTLLNDLDLVVRGPGGTFLGNVFAAGRSVAGGTADRRNNVEVVLLPDAEKGAWTIEVAPHAVPAPAQDFALVITGPVRPETGPRSATDRRVP